MIQRGLPLSALLVATTLGGAAAAPSPATAAAEGGDGVAMRAQTPAAAPHDAPVEIVRRLCEARKALDPGQMEAVLAVDYRGEQPDGSVIPCDRERGRRTVEWERGMDTRWDCRLLGVDGNAVKVLLTEESAYFDLLGIGTRTQVTVYFVEGGRVARSLSKLDVQQRGSQAREYGRFQEWLLQQMDPPDPELVGPDGRLLFDGRSAARMLTWLKRWHDLQD